MAALEKRFMEKLLKKTKNNMLKDDFLVKNRSTELTLNVCLLGSLNCNQFKAKMLGLFEAPD